MSSAVPGFVLYICHFIAVWPCTNYLTSLCLCSFIHIYLIAPLWRFWNDIHKKHVAHLKVKVLVTQPCLTLCDPMDYSLPGSSVHRILQARILEWVAIHFSRGSSRPRDQTQVSSIADTFFTIWATREVFLNKKFFNVFFNNNLKNKQKRKERLRTKRNEIINTKIFIKKQTKNICGSTAQHMES